MVPWSKPVFVVAFIGAMMVAAGCSSSHPTDMNKGNDAGVGWTPPDLTLRSDLPPVDSANDSKEGPDGSSTEALPADGALIADPDALVPPDLADEMSPDSVFVSVDAGVDDATDVAVE